MTNEYDIEIYARDDGSEPFQEWLKSLRDKRAISAIFLRIQRVRLGNFGDFKHFEGLYELRIDYGPGFRIYCAKIGSKIILLLGGGDKKSQDKDIKNCKSFLEKYRRPRYD
jgi:putative addiction module killer protein